jgi:hypothetical protein
MVRGMEASMTVIPNVGNIRRWNVQYANQAAA